MTATRVKITGADKDQQKVILDDILYIENMFFQNIASLQTNSADDNTPQDENPKDKPISTTSSSPTNEDRKDSAKTSEEISSLEQPSEDTSNEDEENEKLNKHFPDAQKIVLPHVGDIVEAKYAGSGNRYVPKAKQRAFVVYLENQRGEIEFIQGTQLSAALMEISLKIGDVIKIEKIGQFKKAKLKEHARAATFKITLVN